MNAELDAHIRAHLHWGPLLGEDKIRFMALALCGEAGELANIVKKDWRGDPGDRRAKLVEELADVGARCRFAIRNVSQIEGCRAAPGMAQSRIGPATDNDLETQKAEVGLAKLPDRRGNGNARRAADRAKAAWLKLNQDRAAITNRAIQRAKYDARSIV